ncbi:amino acid adenylation domain-containing protein [Pectobacterium zantedeschiae]|uniref:Amino acid adenylation domain-containing protein n=1 Tax=Pectobacterium zantedeschiae TaxID=2034769 RepID=A0A9X8JLI7_9GAMM|nr:amino acid adenylation domain-containing protein [Pectobacterium zantedeschiae]RYC37413.1 peptide synthetase [Pectobacterium zantedeschiae]RYC45901.1 amino acid adenylation domain-containing protein [Pectobacterium zantedeschiae]
MTESNDVIGTLLADIQQPTAFGQRVGAAHGEQRHSSELSRQYPASLVCAAWSWLLYKYSGEELVCAALVTSDLPDSVMPLVAHFQRRDRLVSEWIAEVGASCDPQPAPAVLAAETLHALFSSVLSVGEMASLPVVTQKMGQKVALIVEVQDARLILTAPDGQLDNQQLQRIARDLTRLLDGLLAQCWEWLTQIRLSPQVVPLPHRTRASALHDELLARLAQAARQDGVAIRFQERAISYRELLQRVALIQGMLAAQGITAGQRVGLHLSRQPDTVAALLACLFSQVTFVPLEPDFPGERLQAIQQEAALASVLQDSYTAGSLTFDCPILNLCDLPDADRALSASVQLAQAGGPETAAYMMFTSGSTGKPKGVVIGQRALQTFIHASVERLALTDNANWLLITTLAFDISMLEVFAPLWVGGVLHLTTHEEYKDPQAVAAYLQDRPEINVLQATPAFWRMMFKADWQGKPDLVALCGGEALDLRLAQRLVSRCKTLWNCYGPTEATIWSQMAQIDGAALENQHTVALGNTLAGYQHLVIDYDRHPLTEGMVGELCILGDALSSGYWLRDDLTQERFIQQGESGQRMYRTGDKVRLLEDDRYQYLGRFDDQVKLRGFRIELGEIEAQLKRIEQVQDAAVKLQGEGDDAVLVGYVEYKPGSEMTKLALRKQLHQFLPAYMVPGRIVTLDKLPKTGSGKVDRKRLSDV